MTSNRVDLVDEDDAGCMLLALLEEVANTARADADEHFDEVGAADAEEGNSGFTCDCSGEKRLACARRTDEKDAARDASTEALELFRVPEECNDLLNLVLGFVDARHVCERDAVLRLADHANLGLAKAHCLAAA